MRTIIIINPLTKNKGLNSFYADYHYNNPAEQSQHGCIITCCTMGIILGWNCGDQCIPGTCCTWWLCLGRFVSPYLSYTNTPFQPCKPFLYQLPSALSVPIAYGDHEWQGITRVLSMDQGVGACYYVCTFLKLSHAYVKLIRAGEVITCVSVIKSLTAHQHQKGHTVPKQVITIATSIQVTTV